MQTLHSRPGNPAWSHQKLPSSSRTWAALSDPAKSTMKSFPIRASLPMAFLRLFCVTVTCSTACEQEDVLLAAVGSWVRCLFPFINSCMI